MIAVLTSNLELASFQSMSLEHRYCRGGWGGQARSRPERRTLVVLQGTMGGKIRLILGIFLRTEQVDRKQRRTRKTYHPGVPPTFRDGLH